MDENLHDEKDHQIWSVTNFPICVFVLTGFFYTDQFLAIYPITESTKETKCYNMH